MEAILSYFWIVLVVVFVFMLLKSLTIVREGTAKAVTFFGGFSKVIMTWKDHFLDKDYNVLRKNHEEAFVVYKTKKGAERKRAKKRRRSWGKIMGGVYFYGLWPFKRIHKYTVSWSENHQNGEKEFFNYVSLFPAVYESKVTNCETQPPDRIKVDIEYLVTMRIINPHLYLFVSPDNSIEDAMKRIDSLMRDIVAMFSFDATMAIVGRPEILWEGLNPDSENPEKQALWNEFKKLMRKKPVPFEGLSQNKLIKETLPKWGLKIADKGVSIKDINTSDPEYAETFAEKRKQEILAEAKFAEAQGEKKAMEEVMKAIVTTKKALIKAGYSQSDACKMAYDRHGEILAEKKGNLNKVIWEGSSGSIPEIMNQIGFGKKLVNSSTNVASPEEEKKEEDNSSNYVPPDEMQRRMEKMGESIIEEESSQKKGSKK